ncbi:MAG TPA: hypothetical protein PLS95_01125 [Thermoanaerobaculales bacterium]|jgi:hypothetical protein|nr:hypothetical protein [Thermoanaerobaculales bacterium]
MSPRGHEAGDADFHATSAALRDIEDRVAVLWQSTARMNDELLRARSEAALYKRLHKDAALLLAEACEREMEEEET